MADGIRWIANFSNPDDVLVCIQLSGKWLRRPSGWNQEEPELCRLATSKAVVH